MLQPHIQITIHNLYSSLPQAHDSPSITPLVCTIHILHCQDLSFQMTTMLDDQMAQCKLEHKTSALNS